jgi:hypothetical protein
MRKIIDRAALILLGCVSAAVLYSSATAQFQAEPSPPPARSLALSR